MEVVQLSRFRNRALVESVKEILRLAEEGVVQGHVFVLKFGADDHRAGASGDYKRDARQALTATILMERYLSEAVPPSQARIV